MVLDDAVPNPSDRLTAPIAEVMKSDATTVFEASRLANLQTDFCKLTALELKR